LILGHANVADSDTHAENLLQLELDGGLDFVDLAGQILVVGDGGWEFTSWEMVSIVRKYREWRLLTLRKTRTQETRDLLDQGVGSNEGIVLACELLDELLVLVQLLQVIGAHGVDTSVLSTIDIMLVTENANIKSACVHLHVCIFSDVPDAHAGAGNDRETNGPGETLVTLRIIVLEADLEFDGLEEVSLLGLKGVLKELLDVGTHSGCGEIVSVCSLESLRNSRTRGGRVIEDIPTVIFDMMTVFQ